MIDTNVAPYFDDFDENKNFHRIMFVPGMAVQSRELTQIQSITQDQIRKFGNHIFQHGSVVIPGNSNVNLSASFVAVELLDVAGVNTIDPSAFVGLTLVSSTGVTARVVAYSAATATDPNLFYVSYITGSSTTNTFVAGENLTVSESVSLTAKVRTAGSPIGTGSLAYVNEGVYYVNGFFVKVQKQTIVISKYTTTPSCSVLLKITEDFVSPFQDTSLNDPAQGSNNYAAPGADRYRIRLILTSLPLNTTIDNNYVELIRLENGVILEHNRYPKYSELEKSLARRTNDESGSYRVSGLGVSVAEHLKSGSNGGTFLSTDATPGDATKMVYNIAPGKAYIEGFEVEALALAKGQLTVDKARTASHQKSITGYNFYPSFGQYLYVRALKSLPRLSLQMKCWFTSDGPTGTNFIGSCRVLAMDLEAGVSNSNPIYKLVLSDVTLSPGYSFDDIYGITNVVDSGLGSQAFYATVVHKLTPAAANISFQIGEDIVYPTSAANSAAAVRCGTVRQWVPATSSLYVDKSVATKQTPLAGDLVKGVTSSVQANISTKEVLRTLPGTNALTLLPYSAVASLSTVQTVQLIELSGTSSGTAGGTTVINLPAGYSYNGPLGTVSAGAPVFIVLDASQQVVDNSVLSFSSLTSLTVTAVAGLLGTSLAFRVIIPAYKTTLTRTDKSVASGTMTGTTPAVSITLTNAGNVIADAYQVDSIVSTTDGDVTGRYVLDNGQRDFYYGPSVLNLIAGATLPGGTLTINYKYFARSVGDYCCEDSYPAGVEPSVYRDTAGKFWDLRNCVDFRPFVGTTVNTVNPINSSGAVVVLPNVIGWKASANVSYYMPRIDLVYADKSGKIAVKLGVPADNPAKPSIPDGALALSYVTVPPYTKNVSSVVVEGIKNSRYTMADITRLDDRITVLENYTTLNSKESELIKTNVLDAKTGLSRFKSGYLVDSFNAPEQNSDLYNADFSASVSNGICQPKLEMARSPITVKALNGCVQHADGIVTLPYTETTFAEQPLSSKVTNINPFAVFSWIAEVKLTPAKDTWVDTVYLPTIFNSTSEVVTVVRPWGWTPNASNGWGQW